MQSRRLFLLLAPTCLSAQAPFKPTAEFGKPFIVGEDVEDYGNFQVDYAKKYEVTLESAELSLRFANRREPIIAAQNQKLLILRGTARNLSTTKPAEFLGPMSFAIRVWRRFNGPGEYRHLMMTDPDTLLAESTKLPPGASGKFAQVITIPAGLEAMEFGIYYRTPKRLAWYDLHSPRFSSAFADGLKVAPVGRARLGQFFDHDTIDIRVNSIERYAEGLQATLDIKNPMLLPSRCGWQYFTAELIGTDGKVVRFYPDFTDRATGKTWVGDLDPGKQMSGLYKFPTPPGFSPRTLRLTSSTTNRIVEVELSR